MPAVLCLPGHTELLSGEASHQFLVFVRTRLIPPMQKPLAVAKYQRQTAKRLIKSGLLLAALVVAPFCIGAGLREYNAQEAKKHIGESATVVGKVDCIGHGRRHVDLQIGGCDLQKALLWIVVPDEASGPELDPETVRGVQVAVTGKIESAGGTPQITIKSTTQIVPRTALQTNYIGRAYDKEMHGDFDGAMEDLDKAIAHQPARRDEACQHLAKLKGQKGDWSGALAAYERLIGFDPNNADSYYVRATAKKQHGDFEAAMADFTRAAELRSDPAGFTSIGGMRKERGDIAEANAEYDKAIALCDRQIAGTARIAARSPLGSDPYFTRGYAKELKGDLDGAVADYTHAIANNPARAAMAYGARGNIRRARGDLTGAIADYQHKYQITQYPDDKQKLEQVRAEAKTGAKKIIVTQPSRQAAQNEQSANKRGATPESISQAFVEAYSSGADVDAVAGLYAERVDYMSSGLISNAAVRAQVEEYFTRWPARHWSLVGQVKIIPLGATKQKVMFSANYDAKNLQTNKYASGIAIETLILAADASGAMKIASQKEQITNGKTTQLYEQRSGDLGLNAARTEYERSSQDEAARVRYVTKLADIETQIYLNRHNEAAFGELLDVVVEELRQHPAPRNVDSRKLSQLLVGKWQSPRHVYTFRSDGTYGVADEQRDKWRIDGNEYIDDVSRGPIILLDRNYFIYAEGQGVAFYPRVKDSRAEPNQSSAITTTETESPQGHARVDGNTASNNNAEAVVQRPNAKSSLTRNSVAVLTSAEIVDVPAAQVHLGIKAGNVKVTFSDGHTETITKGGNCMYPHVSTRGDVGWVHCSGFDRKGYALNDKVVVHSSDGGEKELKPPARAPFIGAWAFADNDSAIVIQSMSFHGPQSYIRYDLATGRMTNKKDGRDDSEPVPEWAQPLSN